MVAQILQKQIANIEDREKKVFWTLFAVFVFFIISYGFLLNNTMRNTVLKQKMEKEIVSLGSEVNALEFKYLNTKNNITLSFAQLRGFVPVSADKFATIDSNKKNISLSINEN